MSNFGKELGKIQRRTYAPKLLFYKARAVLQAYYDLASEDDKKRVMEQHKLRPQTLHALVHEVPIGMVPWVRMERVISLVETFEKILQTIK